jgi:hypothetical protein
LGQKMVNVLPLSFHHGLPYLEAGWLIANILSLRNIRRRVVGRPPCDGCMGV